jgi:hypothetical protein
MNVLICIVLSISVALDPVTMKPLSFLFQNEDNSSLSKVSNELFL